ncbi:methyltransferase domain-containing protein [Gammaproteobacteria bacterium AH-315-C21]|nr:methyltransferase domain-containing protein [Gammaproteobacteria bacterium AH-315-C21]
MKRKQTVGKKCKELTDWYKQPLGQRLLEAEQELLDEVLPELFGYHLIQLGSPTENDLLRNSRIHHCSVIDECPSAPRATCCAAVDTLPIDSDSVDVVVMPHTLEYAHEPHQVLREVDRILIPEGHAVIMGFNPWSLWGGWRMAGKFSDNFPWNGHFRSVARIKDWCKLLGFDTLSCHHYFYRPPIQHSGVMDKLQFMERMSDRWQPPFAAGYMLLTRKRESMLTPVRPSWPAPQHLLGAKGLARPAARDKVHYLYPNPKND